MYSHFKYIAQLKTSEFFKLKKNSIFSIMSNKIFDNLYKF